MTQKQHLNRFPLYGGNNSNDNKKIIWTAKAIGARIGRSEAYVRRKLAKMENSPVMKKDGDFYAFEDDLINFFMMPF